MRTLAPLLLLALSACETPQAKDLPVAAPSNTTAPSTSAANGGPSAVPADSTKPADSTSDPGPKLPPATPDEQRAAAKSVDAFALDLYAKLRETGGNLAFSPLSLATALTMTWGGANGDTAAEMQRVLHLEGSPDKAMTAAAKLLAGYRDPSKKFTLRVENRLFGEKTYAFEKPFLDRTSSLFGAPLEPLDFKTQPDASRRHVNEWVAKETHDRVKDLLPPDSVKSDARLILTNAVYFLADWETPFDKASTSAAPFHPAAGAAHDVPTMHAREGFRYAHQDGVRLLELPYQGGETAMTFLLPDKADGLTEVEKKLDIATLERWIGAMKGEEVAVSLPKVTLDPAQPMTLADTMKALGMNAAFDRDKADFSGMSKPPTPDERLYVSSIFHKAFVKLDEKGTEAAAASAVQMAMAGGAAPSKEPEHFDADHPFLFLLRDVRSGAILFMGRVADPAAK